MIITDVLERWPETAEVFHEHTMACVGCAVAPFYTINDAAIVYKLSPEALIEEFLAIIGPDLHSEQEERGGSDGADDRDARGRRPARSEIVEANPEQELRNDAQDAHIVFRPGQNRAEPMPVDRIQQDEQARRRGYEHPWPVSKPQGDRSIGWKSEIDEPFG